MEEKDYNLRFMKIVRQMKAALLLFVMVFCFQLVSLNCYANNVRVTGKVDVKVTAGLATISFPLEWENSWRDAYNWDGVWLFIKYKSLQGEWKHVYLQNSKNHKVQDERTGGTDTYDYMLGANGGDGGNDVVGLIIHRTTRDFGPASITCELLWDVTALGFSQPMFDSHQVSVMVQAVEMIYVPNGAYSLGDSYSNKTFISQVIKNERDTVVMDTTGGGSTSYSLSADYPKGYNGFYCMKYELSQEQYVTFLNSLTLAQQWDLLGTDINNMEVGHYLNGLKDAYTRAPHRNGIVMSWKKQPEPYAFDNNLSGNDIYGEDNDGQVIACNYLGIKDLLAYCEWAGLRPMSELEYEKTCRRPYPESARYGEFAWNVGGAVKIAGAITDEFGMGETVTTGNANFGGVMDGPLRCGAFAKSTPIASTQPMAGSAYWGAMEMSGNVQELCVNATGRLGRSVHGKGIYPTGNSSSWSSLNVSAFGLRGGSYKSDSSELHISDRTNVNYFKSKTLQSRENAVGFRAVRSVDPNTRKIDPGVLSFSGNKTLCPEVQLVIKCTPAKVEGVSDIYIRYEWYANGELITNQTRQDLEYNSIRNDVPKYTFYRKAFCAYGEAQTEPMSFNVTKRLERVSPAQLSLSCDTCSDFKVRRNSESTITWKAIINGDDKQLAQTSKLTESSFTPTPEVFGYGEKAYVIRCYSEASGLCQDSMDFKLYVRKSCSITLDTNTAILANNVVAAGKKDRIKASVCAGKATFSGLYQRVSGQPMEVFSIPSSRGEATFIPTSNIFPDSVPGKRPVWIKAEIPHVLSANGCVDSVQAFVDVRDCKISFKDNLKLATITGTGATSLTMTVKNPGKLEWWIGATNGVMTAKGTNAVYTPGAFDFSATANDVNVLVRYTSEDQICKTDDHVKVNVQWYCGASLTGNNLGYPAADVNASGKSSYNTAVISKAVTISGTTRLIRQCWMQENVNIGTFDASNGANYTLHRNTRIDKICYNNDNQYCILYGGLYSWQEAVNGGKASTADEANYKYMSGNSGAVQGICPDGWHMPSDDEFKDLERMYGMPEGPGGVDRVNTWAGEGIGTKLKASNMTNDPRITPGWYNTYGGTSGIPGDPNSAFRGLPGGYRDWSGVPGKFWYVGTRGYWWSSTPIGSGGYRWALYFGETRVNRYAETNGSYGFSVRCLRN